MTPSTDWKETVDPNEAERFERYAQQLLAMQRKAAHGGRASRGLHAKGQLGLAAAFEVLPDLPEAARVALFARPATFRAYVRFSNGAGARQADGKGDVRGVAIKLVGVAGTQGHPGHGERRHAGFPAHPERVDPFRDADEFVTVLVGAASPPLGILRAGAHLGFGRLFASCAGRCPGSTRPSRRSRRRATSARRPFASARTPRATRSCRTRRPTPPPSRGRRPTTSPRSWPPG